MINSAQASGAPFINASAFPKVTDFVEAPFLRPPFHLACAKSAPTRVLWTFLRHQFDVIHVPEILHLPECLRVEMKQEALGKKGRGFRSLWYAMTQVRTR
jgi:hypothetical protein